MRKGIALFLIVISLSGCNLPPSSYQFPNKSEPISSIELLHYPWFENLDEEAAFGEFELIRTLESTEIPEFMEEIYSLKTRRAITSLPANYGMRIVRVNYENGDTEYFGSRHIEFVESGEKAYAVGSYYFVGDAFDELFLRYKSTRDG